MKNKGLTIVLLLVVGVVWYKVFVRFTDQLEAPLSAEVNPSRVARIHLSKPARVQLNANYRDPFSGKFSNGNEVVDNVPKPVVAPLVKMRKEVYWPVVKYHGLIKKKGGGKALAVVSIDGQFFQLKQGEAVLDDILLKSVQRDSIILEYHKTKRVFRR